MVFSFTGFSQVSSISDIEKYKTALIPQTFDNIKEEDKNNFKILRNYLTREQNLEAELNHQISKAEDNSYYINLTKAKIKILKDSINSKQNESDKILLFNGDYEDENYRGFYNEKKLHTVKQIKERIILLENNLKEFQKKFDEIQMLSKNKINVQADIQNCQNQIDEALNPEISKQGFKTKMSTFFVGLIALILICFFSIIYIRSDKTLSKDLLGGYGLQFITLFVLIIAIILFGILDILKGSELAAMLSGISGYILGKGIQDKKSITENTTADLSSANTISEATNTTDTIVSETVIAKPIMPENPEPIT